MKNKFSLLCAIIFASCAHNQAPEATKSLQMAYSEDLLEEVQREAARFPASTPEIAGQEKKSLRRVYFTVLYQQYLKLAHVVHASNEVKFCPQFHHDKIEVEEKHQGFNAFTKVENPQTLNSHFSNIKEEVLTLCDEGRSDNYYKFDNLITYHANRAQFHRDSASMKAVLKIPVFANYYLLKMMTHPSEFITQTNEEKEMIQVSKTFWFERYVVLAQTYRNGMIKAEMVKR